MKKIYDTLKYKVSSDIGKAPVYVFVGKKLKRKGFLENGTIVVGATYEIPITEEKKLYMVLTKDEKFIPASLLISIPEKSEKSSDFKAEEVLEKIKKVKDDSKEDKKVLLPTAIGLASGGGLGYLLARQFNFNIWIGVISGSLIGGVSMLMLGDNLFKKKVDNSSSGDSKPKQDTEKKPVNNPEKTNTKPPQTKEGYVGSNMTGKNAFNTPYGDEKSSNEDWCKEHPHDCDEHGNIAFPTK